MMKQPRFPVEEEVAGTLKVGSDVLKFTLKEKETSLCVYFFSCFLQFRLLLRNWNSLFLQWKSKQSSHGKLFESKES